MPFNAEMACAKLNANTYRTIGASETVIRWLEQGVPLPFKSIPNKYFAANRIRSKKEEQFVDGEIAKLLESNTIKKVREKPKCILALQCVPKKNKKLRLVLDSRPVNIHIDTPKFSQEGIKTVAELIQPGDVLASIDLEQGFHHVPIAPEFQTYLGFKWKGHYFVWQYLPFGVSCAPYYFYKCVRPVVRYLRQNNIRLSSFVDDFLLMMRKLEATDHIDFTVQVFQECGWKLNWEKCELEPSTVKVFVGYEVSTHRQEGPWVKVIPTKIRKLRRIIVKSIQAVRVTARHLARLIGQCIAMTKAIIPAKLLLRNSYRVLASRDTWDSYVQLTPSAIRDLQWWLTALKGWNGAPLILRNPDIQIRTDASTYGWGGIITGTEYQASGQWNTEVSTQHSNFRELLAVYMTIQSFKDHLKGRNVQVLSDNVTTVAYINHMGGPCKNLTDLMTTLWSYTHELKINLTAKHLAGAKNFQADWLSRIASPYDWKLHPVLFRNLNEMWGPHTVDRFAALHNCQIPRYNSMFMDPQMEAVDALAQSNWNQEMNFCNPPFHLIQKILTVLEAQSAEATIIAPWWPAQTWSRKLKQMSVDYPIEIPNVRAAMWTQGVTVPEPQKNPKWKIFAWRVSGKKKC